VTRICLDTSAYSQFRRGHAPVVDLLDGAKEILVPAVVIGELQAGFRLGKLPAQNEAELRAFLAHAVVSVVDVDAEAASHYADLWVDLRNSGTPIPTNDVWIGALALRSGSTIVTYDDHFRVLSRVGSVVLST
jgi:tRNA(fMet)-specific endonuclease VapC